ncbi:hypothetical protein P8C59_005767 [Phyllachora maydis]|uniref:Peptidase A1 domain-containing protein n=1 Tax=Phyllachora maydis TaxID=1825666 RepID=A0AAD9I672_9PEZI|nr:hypothetical protein P8C59_005767 [Phyllachora maydis]
MHALSLLFLLLASSVLGTTASRLPTIRASTSSASFSVDVAHNAQHTPDGPAAYARALAKWGSGVPTSSAASASFADDKNSIGVGDVPASPQLHDKEYLCSVQIGNPAQTVKIDLDTGSADFWVATPQTPTVGLRPTYDPRVSTSATVANGTFRILYGDGSFASGVTYSDDVSIGGLTVPNVLVETVQEWSTGFTSDDAALSGILGLAYKLSSQVSPAQPAALTQLAAQLASPLFTADLRHQADGAFTFGRIDDARHTGALAWTPVQPEGFPALSIAPGHWAINFTGYTVGGNGTWWLFTWPAIVDTGTSLLLLQADVAAAYYAAVPGAQNSPYLGGWMFPCDAALPAFQLGFASNFVATVPAAYLNYADLADNGFPGMCYGGIQSSQEAFAILGDVFLKSVFAVFDVGNGRVGFANKNLG